MDQHLLPSKIKIDSKGFLCIKGDLSPLPTSNNNTRSNFNPKLFLSNFNNKVLCKEFNNLLANNLEYPQNLFLTCHPLQYEIIYHPLLYVTNNINSYNIINLTNNPLSNNNQ